MRRLGCVIVDHDVGILGVDIDFGIRGIGSGAGRFGGRIDYLLAIVAGVAG